MEITGYTLRKLVVPRDRPIGDSQVDLGGPSEIAYLELETDAGVTGVGFDGVNFGAPSIQPPEALHAAFEPVGERLVGASPFALRNRIDRPRGGNYDAGTFGRLVDFALWDLCGKHLDLPAWELMGGDDPRVPAYASGLAFRHDDETVRELYERFAALGLESAKVKVGYPTIEEDVERLSLVRDVMGSDGKLMIDANEAFSPKEAVRRVRAYEDAGFDIYWVEDPVFRAEIDGIRRVVQGLPDTHVNTGEYVDIEGKRELLEHGACDILNVHGLSSARTAAELAARYGVPVSLGNTPAEVGIHAAASLPEVVFIEYSMGGWQDLLEEPVTFEDGHAIAPDRPGTGLAFAADALAEYERSP